MNVLLFNYLIVLLCIEFGNVMEGVILLFVSFVNTPIRVIVSMDIIYMYFHNSDGQFIFWL